MKVKLLSILSKASEKKYYQNPCQKIMSGKIFSFSTLTEQKNVFPDFFRLENDETFFPYFLRVRSNPAH